MEQLLSSSIARCICVLVFVAAFLVVDSEGSQPPNILLIVADDYGWNDVGYHNPEMYTPTIDKLANAGVKLDNYYVQPICTPSRSQLLSGKYQIHTGLQHLVLRPPQRNGLPLEEVTMADRLRSLGYTTHIVGKWHLGFYKKEYMPLQRGFDTHFGEFYFYIHTGLQHLVVHPPQPNGLPLEEVTMADRLRSLGYATHIVGKWHLGFYKKEYMPLHRGFDTHFGLQHDVLHPAQASGLPLEDVTLADRLGSLGYATHIVGKWHLGHYKKEFMPTYRGFDSHFGFLLGSEDYYTHKLCYNYPGKHPCGTDLRDNEAVVWNNTDYSAQLFAHHARNIITQHDANRPLFLYLPFQSVHLPLEVPAAYEKRYAHIKNKKRRTFSGMVSCMDEAIENVTQALKESGLWDNTLIVFSTDNGGINSGGGNNYPLRGEKHTLWEGGVRGVGFVHGQMLKQKGVVSRQLMHISDWYPTLFEMAGGHVNESMKLDGYNVWDTLSSGAPSPRKELLHNIDPLWNLHGNRSQYPDLFDVRVHAAIRVDNWKLITGDPGTGNWIPPPNSTFPRVKARDDPDKNLWLFDLEKDPYEHTDVSTDHPDVVKTLLAKLAAYNATAVPCRYPDDDPKSAPDLHGGAWGPWM